MNTIQFYSVEPNALIKEIAENVKTELLAELTKIFRDNEPKRYLSADEICQHFGITKPTLHDWKNRKIVKSYKLGGRVYYRLSENRISYDNQRLIYLQWKQ